MELHSDIINILTMK